LGLRGAIGLRVFGFVNPFVYDHIRKEKLIKKWLNINSKAGTDCEERCDINLLSEIITNSIYWQEIWKNPPLFPTTISCIFFKLTQTFNYVISISISNIALKHTSGLNYKWKAKL